MIPTRNGLEKWAHRASSRDDRRTRHLASARTPVTIGVRKRPHPKIRASCGRLDSIHQGDHAGVDARYFINVVNRVAQFQAVFAVAGISEAFVLPAFDRMIDVLPFAILHFHFDHGRKNINHQVAKPFPNPLI